MKNWKYLNIPYYLGFPKYDYDSIFSKAIAHQKHH